MNFVELKCLKCKTNSTLTIKCYMTKYDKIMNQILLWYRQVEKKNTNFPWVFPECFDFPRNFHEFSRFSLTILPFPDFSLIFQVFPECCEPCTYKRKIEVDCLREVPLFTSALHTFELPGIYYLQKRMTFSSLWR